MTADDFDEFVRSLGLTVEVIRGEDESAYSAARGFEVPNGALRGRRCDIAVQRWERYSDLAPSVPEGRNL